MELIRVNLNSNFIRNKWENLYKNACVSPYMKYEFQSIYKKYLIFGKQRLFAHYKLFAAVENNEIVAFIPLIKIKENYYIAGDKLATGLLDFLYLPHINKSDFYRIITLLKESIGECNLCINKIYSGGGTATFIEECGYSPIKCNDCVQINLPNIYSEYYNALSKSVRQNIRTAINRLNREEKNYHVQMLKPKEITREIQRNIMRLYHKRSAEKNDHHGNLMTLIYNAIADRLNPMSVALFKLDISRLFVLYIDNEIAGFFHGFLSNDKRLIVPRLAINTKYRVYCPGSLLINEAVKILLNNSTIRILDLSRGDEQYKFSMGGTCYQINDYVI